MGATPIDYDRVEASGLVKTYGPTRALAGVDLALHAGTVTAVIGPNGSGKSTLLGILSLLVKPTRGTVRFGPHDALAAPEPLRATIGVLAHAAMVYPDLTGAENLELAARLYGVPDPTARIAELRERFEIGGFADRPTRTCSRGQLQRIALARALVHRPRLLLLDEPSTGLDTSSVDRLVEAVRAERARGAIQLLVTHDDALTGTLADQRLVLGHAQSGAAPHREAR